MPCVNLLKWSLFFYSKKGMGVICSLLPSLDTPLHTWIRNVRWVVNILNLHTFVNFSPSSYIHVLAWIWNWMWRHSMVQQNEQSFWSFAITNKETTKNEIVEYSCSFLLYCCIILSFCNRAPQYHLVLEVWFYHFTPMISLVILLSVYHTILMK